MSRTITKFQVQNYANHADSVATFEPGMNWIVGPNNAGKSQFLSALLTVLLNDAIPTDARSIGADGKPHPGTMVLRVEFSDGAFIERRSGSKGNTIQIRDASGRTTEVLPRVNDAGEEVRALAGVVEHPTMPRVFPQIQRLGDPLLVADNTQSKTTYRTIASLLFPTRIPQLRKKVNADLRAASAELKVHQNRLQAVQANPAYSTESLDALEEAYKEAEEQYRQVQHLHDSASSLAKKASAFDPKIGYDQSLAEDLNRLKSEVEESQQAAQSLADMMKTARQIAVKVEDLPAPVPATINGGQIRDSIVEAELKVKDAAKTVQTCHQVMRLIAGLVNSGAELAQLRSNLATLPTPQISVCESCSRPCLSMGECHA